MIQTDGQIRVFHTHTGEAVTGQRMIDAFEAVAQWYEENARAVREEDLYAPHVSEARKDEILEKSLAFAQRVRERRVSGFSIWQRVNTHLTGECVALLPRSDDARG